MKDISLEVLYNLKCHEIHDIIETCLLIPLIIIYAVHVYRYVCLLCVEDMG